MGFCCGRYESGNRLSPDHERTIVDRLLAYHPDCDSKIGCGIDYITVISFTLYYQFGLAFFFNYHYYTNVLLISIIGYRLNWESCILLVYLCVFQTWKMGLK